MIGHVAFAQGSPCPTLVVDSDLLPADEEPLSAALLDLHFGLRAAGLGHVLKFALIRTSSHPAYDLDYRFVQCIPGEPPRFDFRGSCGHSILASVVVAQQMGLIHPLAPGGRIRTRVENTSDIVVCEVDQTQRRSSSFTVHFLQRGDVRPVDLLLTGEPVLDLTNRDQAYPVSIVAGSNPYVFVKAKSLGLDSREALFSAGEDVFDELSELRAATARLLGWPADGAFPKIAAVGGFNEGRLAARALSVPGWHPSLALTGLTCLGVAAHIPGSIVNQLAVAAQVNLERPVAIDTPAGEAVVRVSISDVVDQKLGWVSVGKKTAELFGPIELSCSAEISKEEKSWLPVPA